MYNSNCLEQLLRDMTMQSGVSAKLVSDYREKLYPHSRNGLESDSVRYKASVTVELK